VTVEGPESKPTRAYQSVRRAQGAAATREAILAAAMRLFLEHDYGKVTVNDIAHAAKIAVPTVYASTGGKSAILGALIEEAMRDPIVSETLAAVDKASRPREVMRVTAKGVRADSQRYHEMIRVMEAAARLDESAAQILARSDDGYRKALAHAVHRLAGMGALRPGLGPEQATDILWFYFGRESWRILVADRRWTWDLAEQWLGEQAAIAILKPDVLG